MIFQSINPATENVTEVFSEITDEQLDGRLNRSVEAAKSWRQTSLDERADHLRLLATLLRDQRERLASMITEEMGKLTKEALGEVDKCALACDYYADNGAHMLADEPVATSAHHSWVSFVPMGTVLAIMPWNFPLWQVFRCAIPTIMAGNTVLLKHAPNVPRCALAIEQLMSSAGIPNDVFMTLLVSVDQTEKLIVDPRIQGVAFTGSEATGRRIAELAGPHLKKLVLELGGSDPFVVLDDADLDKAVSVAMRSRFNNAGQVCVAAKRFILDEHIAGDFTDRLVEQVKALRVGDPADAGTTLAPMARNDLREKLHKQVRASLQQGADVLHGCEWQEGKGYFYPASILVNVEPGMTAFDDEMFGPVAALIKAKNADHALQLANQSRYGLGGSVWTQDLDRGDAFAEQIEVGSCFVNALPGSDVRMPFGGMKASGLGRELSHYGIQSFCHVKSIWNGGN